MFVSRKKYERLHREKMEIFTEFHALLHKWNTLVTEINAKGGQEFLNGYDKQELTDDEIKKLLSLCHPDKHDGKRLAEDMTKKLLSLRSH